ncbi:helix-turn-helix protein binding domain protein [Mycobacterium phage Boilgate]|nr:helix-turn-helix protein binding domain protein [Mycobacterium phage Boilgate]
MGAGTLTPPTGRLSQATLTRLRDAYPEPENKAERDYAIKAARDHAAAVARGADTEGTVSEAARELAAAREALKMAMARARGVALAALESGAFEKSLAEQLGVDRMTVRDWQGKRRR